VRRAGRAASGRAGAGTPRARPCRRRRHGPVTGEAPPRPGARWAISRVRAGAARAPRRTRLTRGRDESVRRRRRPPRQSGLETDRGRWSGGGGALSGSAAPGGTTAARVARAPRVPSACRAVRSPGVLPSGVPIADAGTPESAGRNPARSPPTPSATTTAPMSAPRTAPRRSLGDRRGTAAPAPRGSAWCGLQAKHQPHTGARPRTSAPHSGQGRPGLPIPAAAALGDRAISSPRSRGRAPAARPVAIALHDRLRGARDQVTRVANIARCGRSQRDACRCPTAPRRLPPRRLRPARDRA
jgi:hypothetical protein